MTYREVARLNLQKPAMNANEHASNRTHCKRGHARTPGNTRITSGGPQCDVCYRIRSERRKGVPKPAPLPRMTPAELAILAELETRKTYGVKIAAEVQKMTPAQLSRI